MKRMGTMLFVLAGVVVALAGMLIVGSLMK